MDLYTVRHVPRSLILASCIKADVEKVLAFVEILRARHPGDAALASEVSLAEDWLRPEEDAAWAHL